MFGLGAGEILLILVFALIFIGPKKLPELAKNMGKAFRDFQNAKNELVNEVKNSMDEAPKITESDIDSYPENDPHHHEGHLDENKINDDTSVEAEEKKEATQSSKMS